MTFVKRVKCRIINVKKINKKKTKFINHFFFCLNFKFKRIIYRCIYTLFIIFYYEIYSGNLALATCDAITYIFEDMCCYI